MFLDSFAVRICACRCAYRKCHHSLAVVSCGRPLTNRCDPLCALRTSPTGFPFILLLSRLAGIWAGCVGEVLRLGIKATSDKASGPGFQSVVGFGHRDVCAYACVCVRMCVCVCVCSTLRHSRWGMFCIKARWPEAVAARSTICTQV